MAIAGVHLAGGPGLPPQCEGLQLDVQASSDQQGCGTVLRSTGSSQGGLGKFLVLLPGSSMSLDIYLASLGLTSLSCTMGIMVASIY